VQPRERELREVAHQYLHGSDGTQAETGRWARGPAFDGEADITFVDRPGPYDGDAGRLGAVDPRAYGTPATLAAVETAAASMSDSTR
jgi:Mn-containing catalase